MRQPTRLGHFSRLAAGMLLGGTLFLFGVATYWRWLALVGYLVTIAAWWAIVRPRLTTRRVPWPCRRHG